MSEAADDNHAIVFLGFPTCLGSGSVFHPWLFLLLDGWVAFVVEVLEEGLECLRLEVLLVGWCHVE